MERKKIQWALSKFVALYFAPIYCYLRGKHAYLIIFDYLGEQPPTVFCRRCFSSLKVRSLSNHWPDEDWKKKWSE